APPRGGGGGGGGGSPPVPAMREGPVEGEDEAGGTRRAGLLDTAEHVVAGSDPVDLEQGLRVGRHHLVQRPAGEGAETEGGTAGGGGAGHGQLPVGVHRLHAGGRANHRQRDVLAEDGRGQLTLGMLPGGAGGEAQLVERIDVVLQRDAL